MMCCDLSMEVTGCLLNETDVSGPCDCCPLAEKVSGDAPKEQVELEECEETLI